MRCVRCDHCQFGMTTVDSEGNVGLACKATVFVTNDEYIAEAVNRHCFGGHDHIELLSSRAKSCEKYSPRSVAAILRALRQSMQAAERGEAQRMMGRDRQLTIAAVEAGPTLEKLELLSLPDKADGDQEFRDRSTGLPLNPEMVKKARTLAMQYMEGLKFLKQVDRRSRLIGSTSTRAIRSDQTTETGWSVKRHVDGQLLMWMIGQRRSLRHRHVKRSNCN